MGIGTKLPERKLDLRGDMRVRGGFQIDTSDDNNSTLHVTDEGILSMSSSLTLHGNLELQGTGELQKGSITQTFGNIAIPHSNITTLQATTQNSIINDMLRVKNVVVENSFDISTAHFVVNNTYNETEGEGRAWRESQKINDIMVGNLNVSTLCECTCDFEPASVRG